MENPKTVHTWALNKMPKNESKQEYDMIVFCHLRWEFVYQRPQHLISRMAQDFKILMVEEPIHFEDSDENTAVVKQVSPQLHILQPKVRNIEAIAGILQDYVKGEVQFAWFYAASFLPVLDSISFDTIVYDCMDELSLFKGAPQQLIDQEKTLLKYADLVFTGGKSLYESKKLMHENVYCFPSSVDESHFAQALNGIAIPQDIAQIPGPIVGYFGVIDERIDLQLLNEVADQMADVSFVMIGPLAKIHENDLPKNKNIHYLGMKSYEELPAYLKAFDVAMMPFALNDATKFISPTKTLEYMAAGKPIISTKIKDVVRDYNHCVHLVENADEFCKAIIEIIEGNKEKPSDYKIILQNTSWDATAAKMKSLIKQLAL